MPPLTRPQDKQGSSLLDKYRAVIVGMFQMSRVIMPIMNVVHMIAMLYGWMSTVGTMYVTVFVHDPAFIYEQYLLDVGVGHSDLNETIPALFILSHRAVFMPDASIPAMSMAFR